MSPFEPPGFDYEDQMAQYADSFARYGVIEESFDNYYRPFLQSEGSGSLYPSSSSLPFSFAAGSGTRDGSSAGAIIPPAPPLSTITMGGYERDRYVGYSSPQRSIPVHHHGRMDIPLLVHTPHPAHRSGTRPLEMSSGTETRRTTTRPRKRRAPLTPEPSRKRARKTDSGDEYLPTPPQHISPKGRLASAPRAHSSSTSSIKPPPKSRSKGKPEFICPECGRVNTHMGDHNRHCLTHIPLDRNDQTKGWWCKGVLLSESHKHKGIPESATPYLFLGQERIGGCRGLLSRQDSLSRHIKNPNNSCIGQAVWATKE